MAAVLDQVRRESPRPRRAEPPPRRRAELPPRRPVVPPDQRRVELPPLWRTDPVQQRLDLQGLRMVAVLAVFAFHLCGWPPGGFIGVDVFFVLSGFLITGMLLRMADSRGHVSFRRFYLNRVLRIVPAATVVLICTYLASVMLIPSRAHQVGVDAWFAFIFLSNWRFAAEQTDHLAAGDAVSPIQHYWALSVEQQFLLAWPALILMVVLVGARMAWRPSRRKRFAVAVIAYVVLASLAFALHETAAWPTWAYFNTFARVWELGVGALLATVVGALGRIPVSVKPWLSRAGLALIAAGLVVITDASAGFPAPWALLPVAGTALVIAAGVESEPVQGFLQNPASVYLGNISYSLYLVHWPVIVFLAALMPSGTSFFVAAIALTLALAVGCYHFVENPLRHFDWHKTCSAIRELRHHRISPQSRYAAAAVLVLLAIGLTAYAMGFTARPTYAEPPLPTHAPAPVAPPPPPVPLTQPVGVPQPTNPVSGPLTSTLQQHITAALSATQWPQLDPSMEAAMTEPWPSEINRCSDAATLPSDEQCSWGSASAPTRIVVVGDSVAMSYANSLRELALNSGNEIQVHVEAMAGCPFNSGPTFVEDQQLGEACSVRNQHAIDYINANTPTVVIIANNYAAFQRAGGDGPVTPDEWSDSTRQIVAQIHDHSIKIVFLSAPPADKNIQDCYGTGSSVPTNCISRVTDQWLSMAAAEQHLAEAVGGVWVDSRPWFCSDDGRCPSFVGSTPTKRDAVHTTRSYGELIVPVIDESLRAAKVY